MYLDRRAQQADTTRQTQHQVIPSCFRRFLRHLDHVFEVDAAKWYRLPTRLEVEELTALQYKPALAVRLAMSKGMEGYNLAEKIPYFHPQS